MLIRVIMDRKLTEKCEISFKTFFEQAWRTMEPGAPFVPGWHIDCISEHLDAVLDGDIRKLLINVPPRSSKSSMIAVALPAYAWVRRPELRWLFTSYDLKLSKRDSRKCRALIKSPWYQKRWGQRFHIVADQDEKIRFDNDHMGHRVSTATNAGTTGEGGDIICIDDGNNIRQMNSPAYIEQVFYFYDQVLPSRFNDLKTGRIINVQQRCSELDLTGHILSNESGWDHIVIPNEFDERHPATSLGWEDPRTEIGQLYCPARIGPVETEDLKNKLGNGYAGQYQQRPAPGEGQKFKRQWWGFWNPPGTTTEPVVLRIPGLKEPITKEPIDLPLAFEQIVQGWDMAFKEGKENDLVSGVVGGRVGASAFLLDRESGHWDFPTTLKMFKYLSAKQPSYNCPEKMVEDKANGPAVIQSLRNEIPGLIESPIDGGLLALANSMTGYVEAGNVYLPNPNLYPWVWDLIEQFAVFPNGAHDDDVSSICHMLRRIFSSIANSAAPEFRVTPRKGEPTSASHVKSDLDMARELQPHWRRWITVAPGHPGCALWFAETPSGAIRLYRELNLSGLDAQQVGLAIAQASLPDITGYLASVHATARPTLDLFLEKEAFAPIESIGSYAELLEQGIINHNPATGSWASRQSDSSALSQAQFRTQLATIEDGAWDRLRDLLQFQPPGFEELPFDRVTAFALAERDLAEYNRYMAAVEGRVAGEYPKFKLASSCTGAIAALGAARRDEDLTSNHMRAILLGLSAPSMAKPKPKITERPWNPRDYRPGSQHVRLLKKAI